MTRLLAPHRLVTCASPAYLKNHGVPTNIEELACHSGLAFVHGGEPRHGTKASSRSKPRRTMTARTFMASYARTIRIKASPTLKPSSTARRTGARPSSLTWAMRSWRTGTALPSAAWSHKRTARLNGALRRPCSRNKPKAQSASPSARTKPTTPAITLRRCAG